MTANGSNRIICRWMALVAMLGLTVGLTACSKKQTKEDEEPTAEETQKEDESADKEAKKKKKSVVLYEYRFNPNSLTIKKGTTVEFMNKDKEQHNVKIAALDIDENIKSGGTFTHTFETTGEFAVENRLSEKSMKMTIVVKE